MEQIPSNRNKAAGIRNVQHLRQGDTIVVTVAPQWRLLVDDEPKPLTPPQLSRRNGF
jgi:hypothetical protein